MDWDELQRTLDEISDVDNRARRIAEYERLLASMQEGEEGRAEVLSWLGTDLTGDRRLDDARASYEKAIADGGRMVLDPRIGLLNVALAEDDDARVDELLAALLTTSRADELVIGDYEWIGDSLEEAGRLRTALRWFTIPLRDIQPGDVDRMPILALDGRWRVRRALDLPVDAYDEARELWHELNAAQT